MENKKTGSYRYYKSDGWELYIFFTNMGTRSEGQFGVLLLNGSMHPPALNENEEMETELGTMRYYGLDSQIPWAPMGWLFANKYEIPNSWTE